MPTLTPTETRAFGYLPKEHQVDAALAYRRLGERRRPSPQARAEEISLNGRYTIREVEDQRNWADKHYKT